MDILVMINNYLHILNYFLTLDIYVSFMLVDIVNYCILNM